MNRELSNKLYDRFHNIVSKSSLVLRAIECYDGWYNLIYDTLDALDKHAKLSGINIKITEIKESHGTLTITIVGGDKQCEAITARAKSLSSTICECTGKVGQFTTIAGWDKTLSDEGIKLITPPKIYVAQ